MKAQNKDKKNIIITGAGHGLGEALSNIYKGKGEIVVSSDVNYKNSDLNQDNEIHLDVTKEADVSVFVNKVLKKFGRIDIWINNAGIWLPRVAIEDLDVEKAQKLFQVNLFGYIHGVKYAVRQMKKQNYGTIVNIISTTAFDGMNGSSGSIYVSSKYAIRGFTNSVREELKDTNISVIGVYPGGMKTDLFNEAKPDNFEKFMSVEEVAQKIVENLESDVPELDFIIKKS